jgi:hypothetical protein
VTNIPADERIRGSMLSESLPIRGRKNCHCESVEPSLLGSAADGDRPLRYCRYKLSRTTFMKVALYIISEARAEKVKVLLVKKSFHIEKWMVA